ncbi:MAG: formylglycine-generating enzyme family protein, partial [Planctomycetes bacterium]|nr:formylglycine-generating enzyme family protein [Planctomycetota bacterium]
GFHEVYRVVPAPDSNAASATFAHARWQVLSDGTIELPNIEIPRDGVVKGMTRFAGGTFTMGARRVPDLPEAFRQMLSQVAPPTDKDVPAFFLDQTETTIGEYQQGGGNLHPALAGLPGSHPVTLVGFDEAVAYAERMGKRLPTEVEYEFAATVGGTQGFPWGEEEARVVDWTFGAAGEPDWDRTPTQPPVYGLYSNVAEWTLSWLRPYRTPPFKLTDAGIIEGSRRGRVVRGGPSSLAKGEINPTEWKLGPEWRWALPRDSQYPGLGFRCARSERPRFLAQASSGGP